MLRASFRVISERISALFQEFLGDSIEKRILPKTRFIGYA